MIRLHTLGTIALAEESGAELAPVLRQPKRFALLVYLVLARPRGFHRRDSLLALFWPEMDEDHARAALRQALYTLRRQLPEGVLANRGDGEVGVVPGAVWSDAAEFEARVAAGRPAEALELYRGELLPGFHVPDATSELEQWLDAERSRFRDLAVGAAVEAAEAAASANELEDAVRWAARASALAPLDEERARREMELRHRSGDRAGALLGFEQWAQRFEEDLGLAPSPQTLELVERIRREPPEPATPKRSPVAGRREASGSPAGSRPEAAEPRPMTRRGGWPTPRRVWQLASGIAVVLVLVLLSTLAPIRLDWSDGAAAPVGARVMVLPFSYVGAGEASYLSEGLVYLFSVALDGDDLRTLDPHGLLRRVGEGEGDAGEHDARSAAVLADRLGASFFLLGSVVEAGGNLQLTASLYDRHDADPVAQATATGSPAQVLNLVDAVAAELLATLAGGSSRITRLAAVTSHSLPALKDYLAGERLMRQGRYDAAIEAFQEAVAGDSLFALAHYRTSQAASWAFRGRLSTEAAGAAARLADRLPEHERRLVLGHEAYRRGDGPAALEILRDLSRHYPDDPEVWYRLGEVRMHFGPLHGWPITDARAPFERAVELDANRTDALYHLAQLAALAGDTAAALEYVEVSLEMASSAARAPQLRVLRSCLSGSRDWAKRMAELATADDFTVVSAVYNASIYAGRLDRGREIAALLVSPDRARSTRVLGRLILAEIELAAGRWRTARAHLDELSELEPELADHYRALLAAAPGARMAPAEVASLVDRLARAANPAPTRGAEAWRPEERYAPLPYLYSLGTAAALAGDSARLQLALDGLSSDTTIDYIEDVRLAAAEYGSGPMPQPGPPRFDRSIEEAILSPFLSRPSRRFLEARRLEREGRLRAALLWYESLDAYSVHDLPWGIPALVDRARVHERLGETAEAVALYRRYAQIWRNADDPAPRREAVDGLARLTDGEP